MNIHTSVLPLNLVSAHFSVVYRVIYRQVYRLHWFLSAGLFITD